MCIRDSGSAVGNSGNCAALLCLVGSSLLLGSLLDVVRSKDLVLVQNGDGGLRGQRSHSAALHGDAPVSAGSKDGVSRADSLTGQNGDLDGGSLGVDTGHTGSLTDAASLIVAQLLYLEAQDPDKDIQMYINSPGGSVTAGMAIYDTMQYIKCDVSTICIGMAASMGAFLLSSGAKGKRIALPNAEIMIHQPSAGTQGKVTDMEIDVEHFLKIKQRLNKIMAENTGKTPEQIKTDSERDNWMIAEEAREYGLVDKVIYKR